MIGDINMPIIDKKELREIRKQKFAQMEQQLKEIHPNEKNRLFYHHSSEDRIVLSHALFWTMTLPQNFKSKIRKEKFFLLLRQYQEEMLDAFLQDDDYFSDLLHYCTLMYEIMPTILMSSYLREEKDSRRLEVSTDRVDNAEADEDGGGGREKYEINSMGKPERAGRNKLKNLKYYGNE